MTEEVAELVLAENVHQNDILGLSRQHAADDLGLHARLISDLESRRGLDRTVLALPTPAEIGSRRSLGRGLTSPELAVLAAHAKLDLRDTLLAGTVPDDPAVQPTLHAYFPAQLRDQHPDTIQRHPLRREIVATELVNLIVGTAGPAWVHRMMENTTATVDDVVRAYLITATVFDLPSLWQRARHDTATTTATGELVWETIRVLDRACRWLLQRRPQPLDIATEISRLRPAVAELSAAVPVWHAGRDHIDYLHRLAPVIDAGADPALADTIFGLLERFCLLDITEIAHDLDLESLQVAPLYYLVKESRDIDRLLTAISNLPRHDRWSALARLGLRDDLYESVRSIVTTVLATTPAGADPADALRTWEDRVGVRLTRIESVVDASRSAQDLANLAVAARQIRTLALLTAQPVAAAASPR